jgi:hypothetical protein
VASAKSLALALACAGCLDTLGPPVGSPLRATCDGTDSDPDVDVRFETEIRLGVFDRSDVHCTRCHTPGGESPIGLQVGGLDLSSLTTLRAGGVQGGDAIIRQDDPCASVLIQKLGAAPPFGARMPLDGPPYVTATDLLILDWIVEGARDN